MNQTINPEVCSIELGSISDTTCFLSNLTSCYAKLFCYTHNITQLNAANNIGNIIAREEYKQYLDTDKEDVKEAYTKAKEALKKVGGTMYDACYYQLKNFSERYEMAIKDHAIVIG